MNKKNSLGVVQDFRGSQNPLSTSFTADVLPEAETPTIGKCSQTGVSTGNAPLRTTKQEDLPHWFALRTTYGREKKAYEYIISHNGTAFYPTITKEKVVNEKKKLVVESRLPNIFFAYGTEEYIKSFVYDNVNLPYLRFYYKHTHLGVQIKKTPMIVPDSQIRSLQIICESDANNDVVVLQEEVKKFKTGEKVKVIEGQFKGVEGVVARFAGQLRVGIVIEGLLTAITAYVPNAFIEKTEIKNENI